MPEAAVEDLKKGIASIREFVETRVTDLDTRVKDVVSREEMKRVTDSLEGLLKEQKDAKRDALRREVQRDGKIVVADGKYAGCTPLDLAIVNSLLKRIEREPDRANRGMLTAWRENVNAAIGSVRAMSATSAAAGDELVPTALAAELWRDIHLQAIIAPLFPTINMPTNPFEVPLDLGNPNWYPGTPNTATTGTDLTTAKRTLTAFELVAMVSWAYDLDEDAVLAVLPEFRSTIIRSGAENLDDVILNADTTVANGINSDGATIAASDTDGVAQWLIGFDGLRHIPLVDNTGQATDLNAALTTTSAVNYVSARALLGKYGVRPSELAFVTDVVNWMDTLKIADIATLEKYGPSATILTGEVARIGNVPVIVSEVMRQTDDDGKVTDPVGAAGNDNSGILCVNRTQYAKGFRRELTIESERDIQKRQTVLVASMRVAFDGRTTNASDQAVGLIYNIT